MHAEFWGITQLAVRIYNWITKQFQLWTGDFQFLLRYWHFLTFQPLLTHYKPNDANNNWKLVIFWDECCAVLQCDEKCNSSSIRLVLSSYPTVTITENENFYKIRASYFNRFIIQASNDLTEYYIIIPIGNDSSKSAFL